MTTLELNYRSCLSDADGRFRMPFADSAGQLSLTAWKYQEDGSLWHASVEPRPIELTDAPISGVEIVQAGDRTGAAAVPQDPAPLHGTRHLPQIPDREFGFELRNARANAAAALFVGTAPQALPLDFLGFVGCTLLSGADIAALPRTVDGARSGFVPFRIRPEPAVAGARLYTQWAVLDPTGPGGLRMTAGIESVLAR